MNNCKILNIVSYIPRAIANVFFIIKLIELFPTEHNKMKESSTNKEGGGVKPVLLFW